MLIAVATSLSGVVDTDSDENHNVPYPAFVAACVHLEQQSSRFDPISAIIATNLFSRRFRIVDCRQSGSKSWNAKEVADKYLQSIGINTNKPHSEITFEIIVRIRSWETHENTGDK
jgi:hypothetical protein